MESKKSQLELWDWQRLLMGDAPFAFLGEIALRALIMFSLLAFVLRWMGKRMGGQISNLELAVMMMLGAILSLPIQSLDAGLLPGVVALFVLLGMQRALSAGGVANPRLERLAQGDSFILVRDGVIALDALLRARVSRRQLFSVLRCKGIRQLGEVQRVYLESGGMFSVLRAAEPRPGLTVLPSGEGEQERVGSGPRACRECGTVSVQDATICSLCHGHRWTTAAAVSS